MMTVHERCPECGRLIFRTRKQRKNNTIPEHECFKRPPSVPADLVAPLEPVVSSDYLIMWHDPGYPAQQHWAVNEREIDEHEFNLIRNRCRLFDVTLMTDAGNRRRYLLRPDA